MPEGYHSVRCYQEKIYEVDTVPRGSPRSRPWEGCIPFTNRTKNGGCGVDTRIEKASVTTRRRLFWVARDWCGQPPPRLAVRPVLPPLLLPVLPVLPELPEGRGVEREAPAEPASTRVRV